MGFVFEVMLYSFKPSQRPFKKGFIYVFHFSRLLEGRHIQSQALPRVFPTSVAPGSQVNAAKVESLGIGEKQRSPVVAVKIEHKNLIAIDRYRIICEVFLGINMEESVT